MDDNQLLRYSRQIMLPAIGIEGQQKLLDSRVLIIGMGGLGSPVAMYLAAAGVGSMTIVDHDQVDLSNLQRQIIHGSTDLQRPKVVSAQETLSHINPDIEINTINGKLDPDEMEHQARHCDVVVDCTDNFTARFMINAACIRASTPLVSGAVIRMEGQVSIFAGHEKTMPCYRCLYREEGEVEESCSETGVLAPVAGIIGSVQATETIKLLLELGTPLQGRVLLLDATTMEWREMKLKKDPDCPVCS